MTRARDLAAGTFELATGGVLKLETSDTTVTDGSVLGKIEFKAPDEASGTDALLVGAAIEAVAEATFAADNNSTELVFKTGASAAADTKMTLTSGGNVGIGVAPADSNSFGKALDVGSATGAALYLRDVDSSKVGIVGQFNEQLSINSKQSNGNIGFYTGASNTQRMLVDSSGNLLVGTTQTFPGHNNVVGCEVGGFGQVSASRDGAEAMQLNRKSSDGNICLFKKDGTTVGSIAASATKLSIGNGAVGFRFHGDNGDIYPWNMSSNALNDNGVDLGSGSARFKDLYLGGGAFIGGTGAANKLDDVEEGNFTPTFSSGFNSISYANQKGAYTKIGRLVTIQLLINLTSATGTSGIIEISGLPFNSANANNAFGGFYKSYNAGFNTNDGDVYHKQHSNAVIGVYSDGGGFRTGNSSGIGTGGEILLVGQYYTA